MADKSNQIVLSALSQAAAQGAGLPLHGSKTVPGLFPSHAAGKQAAQRCLDEGYLHCPTASSTSFTAEVPAKKTKTPPRCYTITEKGLNYLFSQVSPRQVLEDLVRVLEMRQGEVSQLLDVARQMQTSLTALQSNADRVLQQLQAGANGSSASLGQMFRAFQQEAVPSSPAAATQPTRNDTSAVVSAILAQLKRWQRTSGAAEDCPLPELFRSIQATVPGLTIGQFHDVLRHLCDQEQVYLHPWTGPLYDLPEPPQALLVGHNVGYYASLRPGTHNSLEKETADAVRS